MTEAIPATQDADDARLLNLVRAGDTAAFSVLFQRHEQAARRLASELAGSPAELEALVGETFALVLAITQRGGGPTDAFRLYVLTALRRVHGDRLRYRQNKPPADDRLLLDPGAPFVDRDLADLADEPIMRSFLSLPERWYAVLWHTEVERAITANVGPVFGLTRNAVAALRRRAKEGLRQAYLQMYMARLTWPDCRPTAERLGSFILDSLSVRETGEVSEHLSGCAECRAVCAELADISSALRAKVAPVFLGSAAAAYLASSDEPVPGAGSTGTTPTPAIGAGAIAAAPTMVPPATAIEAGPAALTRPAVLTAIGAGIVTGAGAASMGGTRPADGGAGADITQGGMAGAGAPGAGAAGGGWPDLTPWASWAAQRSRWLTVSAAAVLVVAAVALAVVLTSHGPRGDAAAGLAVKPSASPALLKPPDPVSLAPTSDPTSARATPKTSKSATDSESQAPDATPSSAPAAVPELAATVSLTSSGSRHFRGGQIDFVVSDTGSAGTGTVTATITAPPGSWVFGMGQRDDREGQSNGWTCQSSESGATCQHAAIPAGGAAQGTLFLLVTRSGACGLPVQLTAASGNASATSSSQDIQC